MEIPPYVTNDLKNVTILKPAPTAAVSKQDVVTVPNTKPLPWDTTIKLSIQ